MNSEQKEYEERIIKSKLAFYSLIHSLAFGKELKNMVVALPGEILFSTPSAKAALGETSEKKDEIASYVETYLKENPDNSGFVNYTHDPFTIIGLNPKLHLKHGKLMEDEILFTLDHEVAHLVADPGYLYASETIADTFAALMNLKRSGNCELIQQKILNKSMHAAYLPEDKDDVKYYTSNGLYAALALDKEIELGDEDPRKIKIYATELAVHYGLGDESFKRLLEKYRGSATVKNVAKVMFANKDDAVVYRAGRLYLTHIFNRTLKIPVLDGSPLFWWSINRKIEKHEKATGFILNPVEAMDSELQDKSIAKSPALRALPQEQIEEIKQQNTFVKILAEKSKAIRHKL